MTLFRRLYLHYAAAPVRVPDLAPTHRILELLYSPEEAALALGMPLVTRGRASIAELEHASGLAPERVAPALASMMAKGLVLASGRDDQYRSLWDFFFLMTDVSFARLENSPLQHELAKLREQLGEAGWAHDLFASDYPFARVLPYEGTVEQSAALFEHKVKNFLFYF